MRAKLAKLAAAMYARGACVIAESVEDFAATLSAPSNKPVTNVRSNP
jgi:hypothetical protein